MANGSGNMMMLVVLLIVGVALYLYRDKLGGLFGGGGGGGAGGGAGGAPAAGEAPTTAQQISAQSGYPAVSLTEGVQYVANQVVNDIDKNTYQQFTSHFVINLLADVLERHKSELALVYNYNGMSLQPLQGRALAAYSQLVLTVARENGIALNPAYEAMLRSNLFAGSPIVENVTAKMAIAVA